MLCVAQAESKEGTDAAGEEDEVCVLMNVLHREDNPSRVARVQVMELEPLALAAPDEKVRRVPVLVVFAAVIAVGAHDVANS